MKTRIDGAKQDLPIDIESAAARIASIAHRLGYATSAWKGALVKLGTAIRHKPYLFNMTKSRYAMDWLIPAGRLFHHAFWTGQYKKAMA